MAKVNPVKLKLEADKEEKAGRLDRAIAFYRQIVDDNPRDWNTIKKVGDLYARLNKNREAIDEWRKVAEFFAQDGFHLKSIAIWKQINKLDPSALEAYLNLADLYGKQGLMMEAKSQYQFVVDEYLKRGKTREAGDVLKKMADIDPADLKVRSKLADLYTREGNSGRAVDEHVAIADELGKKGHLGEAMQVLEKGLKIDPKSARIRVELARVHLVQKNYEKAGHYLEEAVHQAPNDTAILARLGEAYLGARKIEEAEAIFKRLLELDPGDEESRVQMGRVYLHQGEFDRSYEELLPMVDKMLARRDGDRAAALLQQLVQVNPSHVKSLQKLVEIYQVSRKESAVLATYSQLTEAYLQEDRFEQAASALEILVEREPQNQQHRSKLEFVRGRLAGAGASPLVEEEEFDFEAPAAAPPAGPAAAAPPRKAKASSAPPAARVRPVIEVAGPLSDEDREFIEEHLAEGRVFRKYGLVDKATDQFDAVVARFPDNVEARQELREIFREKNLPQKAAAQCLALAEIFRLKGDEGTASAQEEEAQRLDPSVAVAPAPPPSRAAPAAPPRRPAASAPPEPLAASDEELSFDLEEPAAAGAESALDFGLEADGGAELSSPFIDEEEAPSPAPADEGEEEEEEEIPLFGAEEPAFAADSSGSAEAPAFDLQLDEIGADPAAAEEDSAPAALDLDLPDGPPLAEPAPSFGDEPFSDDSFGEGVLEPAFEAPVVAPLTARPAAPVAESGGAPPELARVFDEVESFVALGFVDDARNVLRDAAPRFGSHPAFAAKLAELGLDLGEPEPAAAHPQDDLLDELGLGAAPAEEEFAPAEPAAPPLFDEPVFEEEEAAAPSSEGAIDFGTELGDLFGAQAAVEEPEPVMGGTEFGDAGLADIFKEFKAGVDKQLGKEDYDTRYNLGIAYKEMGLIDEAIAEFQLAAKDEARLLECSSMLGICFLEKGMPKLAVKWFERGLKAPGRTDDEYAALRYDLAAAFEASGEAARALSLYTDLYGQNANYRDVASKVRELRGAAR